MSNTDKPPRKKGLKCPFFKKDVSEVCHRCELYGKITGMDPQTGEQLDEWGCTFTFLPKLLIEASAQTRQAAASTDKVATEIDRFRGAMVKQNNLLGDELARAPLLPGVREGGSDE